MGFVLLVTLRIYSALGAVPPETLSDVNAAMSIRYGARAYALPDRIFKLEARRAYKFVTAKYQVE